MYAVGRLSSYITRGVSTVSGPFHPFGGAIDIIVVQQKDGTLRSSPWYVRFGKFQGVLKLKEGVVDIKVNGVETDVHMYLNPRGEAYFLREDLDSDSNNSEYNFAKCSSLIDAKNGQSFSRTLGVVIDRKNFNADNLSNEDDKNHEEIKNEASLVLHEEHFIRKPKDDETSSEIEKDVDKVIIANVDSDGIVEIYEKCGPSLDDNEESLKLEGENSKEAIKVVEKSVTQVSCIPPENVSKESQDDEDSLKSNGQLQDESPKIIVEEQFTVSELDDKNPRVTHGSDLFDYENMKGNIRKFPSDSDLIKSYKLLMEEEEEIVHKSKSLPNIWSNFDEFGLNKFDDFSHDPKRILSKWDILRKDAARIMQQGNMAPYDETESKNDDESAKSWSLWPFTKSKSKNNSQKDGEFESGSEADVEKDHLSKSVKLKKKVTPAPEQLKSLNLTQGKNTVTFTFSTAVLGNQQVDARIFLWKWDTHIAISDVDGTITKSDVLGQFMPLVGKDWTHVGVAPLFSAIKENGYEILFLSARSVSQADITREFLINLKQEGKTLPEGPVVISPDGLFPSLFREVIRRAPHEFKIACLEEIMACFPSDWNPFYAGFGNRDTDTLSYVKVGISKEKIFIINPKGEVAVNYCDETQSYTSIHSAVNDIFPPKSLQEEVVDTQ